MTRRPTDNKLLAELASARAKAGGKTFAQAPELFKDIETVKVRIRHAEGKYQWLTRRA